MGACVIAVAGRHRSSLLDTSARSCPGICWGAGFSHWWGRAERWSGTWWFLPQSQTSEETQTHSKHDADNGRESSVTVHSHHSTAACFPTWTCSCSRWSGFLHCKPSCRGKRPTPGVHWWSWWSSPAPKTLRPNMVDKNMVDKNMR